MAPTFIPVRSHIASVSLSYPSHESKDTMSSSTDRSASTHSSRHQPSPSKRRQQRNARWQGEWQPPRAHGRCTQRSDPRPWIEFSAHRVKTFIGNNFNYNQRQTIPTRTIALSTTADTWRKKQKNSLFAPSYFTTNTATLHTIRNRKKTTRAKCPRDMYDQQRSR